MQIKVVSSLAETVGAIWLQAQAEADQHQRLFFVCAPLSKTPLPIYQWIIQNVNSFSGGENVRFVLMDEQVEGEDPSFHYVPIEDEASYERFAFRHFLDPLQEKISFSLPVLKPDMKGLEHFELEQPIDLLILALGVEGNYANVMPMTSRDTGWHIARLNHAFKTAHTQTDCASYAGAQFRAFGMSLGPRQVLAARQIVVIASGESKRALVAELASFDKFDPAFPLSIIHDPDVSERVMVCLTQEIGDAWSRRMV